MMSSLTAKENRRRSPVTQRSAAKKAKPSRPTKGKVRVSAKPKKLNVSRTAKATKTARARPAAKPSRAKSSKPKGMLSKKAASRRAVAAQRKQGRSVTQGKATAKGRGTPTRTQARTTHPVVRVIVEPKPVPSPKAMAAIRAFEHALKIFNRQDFGSARTSFEQIITSFGDQSDIVARVRSYLAICEQKMARASSKTRSPDALYNQGVFEFNRGNVAAAIDIFEKALKSEPRADHLLYSLAAAYARGGNELKSVDALRKAIAVNPIHRSHARHDPDFTPLRSNREFLRVSGLDLDLNEQ